MKNQGRKVMAKAVRFDYGREVEKEVAKLEELLKDVPAAGQHPARWLAVKLLEGDEEIAGRFQGVRNV